MLGEMILLGFSQGSPAVIVEAVSSKSAITMEELVKLDRFSSSNQVAAFYGQSLALVRLLTHRKSPNSLIEFANDSIDRGIATALKCHYDIDGVCELERQWKREVQTFHSSRRRLALLPASHHQAYSISHVPASLRPLSCNSSDPLIC